MSTILLSTLNARYSHTSFGLRCLRAAMGPLHDQTEIAEFTINDSLHAVLADIVERNPRILGLGVYIWNVELIVSLLRDLVRLLPHTTVVLGGPELAGTPENREHAELIELADYVITGEGDHAFAALCTQILAGTPPQSRLINAGAANLRELPLPYGEYTDTDLAERIVYVELSRGCPFTCEFCLSALDIPVRIYPLQEFLVAMDELLKRGLRQFKFVDRTFNLNIRLSEAVLQFFLQRLSPDLFLHFEMIPDRLPDSLKTLLARFPAGTVQLEIGIQTFNADVGELISRRMDVETTERNLTWLRDNTSVHLHTDLITGLPGETLESFAAGFDRLYRLRPQEIQVGILKRLKGTPILRHEESHQLMWSSRAPFEVFSTSTMSWGELELIRLFARFWNLYANSGNFTGSLTLVVGDESPWLRLMHFFKWVADAEQRRHGIALIRLFERMFQYLTEQQGSDPQDCAEIIWRDYTSSGRRDKPRFLREFSLPGIGRPAGSSPRAGSSPARQRRHTAAEDSSSETSDSAAADRGSH